MYCRANDVLGLSVRSVRLFFLLDRFYYHDVFMNGLNSLDETCSEYSLTPNDDLIRFLELKVTACGRGDKGIRIKLVVRVHLLVLLLLYHHNYLPG